MNIEFNFSVKLSDEWIERTIPLIYGKPPVKDVVRASSYQQYEKMWIWSPRPPESEESVTEIAVAIHPAWVETYDGEKHQDKTGFYWRAFVPYHTHNLKQNFSCGTSLTLENAIKESEVWIVNYLGLK